MLVLLVGIGVGMVLAWNVWTEQPQWVEDLYTKLMTKIKS